MKNPEVFVGMLEYRHTFETKRGRVLCSHSPNFSRKVFDWIKNGMMYYVLAKTHIIEGR